MRMPFGYGGVDSHTIGKHHMYETKFNGDSISGRKYNADDLCLAIIQNDADCIERILANMLMGNPGVRIECSERSYMSFLFGVFMGMEGRYRIFADVEPDGEHPYISLRSNIESGPDIIVECRRASSDSEDLGSLADSISEHVLEMFYPYGLTDRLDVYGLAFRDNELSLRIGSTDYHD